ncbi:MAG: hypothetical protein ACP5QA_04295 [Phycisphaerae bacterium]
MKFFFFKALFGGYEWREKNISRFADDQPHEKTDHAKGYADIPVQMQFIGGDLASMFSKENPVRYISKKLSLPSLGK